MIKIELAGQSAIAFSDDFPTTFIMMMSTLAGRKKWAKNAVSFEATAGNIRLLKESDFVLKWVDKTGALEEQEALEAENKEDANAPVLTKYKPAVNLFTHQKTALALSAERPAYAYLLEMGLGKTAIAIANAGYLYLKKEICAVLVIAPKGVHRQWTETEIPMHIDKRIKVKCFTWGEKFEKISNGGSLIFLSMNVDSIRTPKGFDTAFEFLSVYKNRSMMIVDESHLIKNGATDRTRAAWKLGKLAKYRRILTGTPIAKSIIDAWSQFMFLDERILGHRYMTSFRSRYCIMGGWENKQIVGQKNTEEFSRLIAPHSFRKTKDEVLDLPPKTYVQREYEMGEETRKHYNSMRNTYMTMLEEGEITDAPNAAVAALRLQQIVCGYLAKEDGTIVEISSERIEAMLEIVRQVKGQIVIWARFIEDIKRIERALIKEEGKNCCLTLIGETKSSDRLTAVERFTKNKIRFLVSNPQAGGTGLNLQGKNISAIYYSNSFRSLDRWQSEDRIHRMGTIGTVTYFDLIAAKSVDRGILLNLRNKKSISDLTLDEMRGLISSF